MLKSKIFTSTNNFRIIRILGGGRPFSRSVATVGSFKARINFRRRRILGRRRRRHHHEGNNVAIRRKFVIKLNQRHLLANARNIQPTPSIGFFWLKSIHLT